MRCIVFVRSQGHTQCILVRKALLFYEETLQASVKCGSLLVGGAWGQGWCNDSRCLNMIHHSRKSTHNVTEFQLAALVVHADSPSHCHVLLGQLKQAETLLMLLVTPVLFPLWQDKMSAVGKASCVCILYNSKLKTSAWAAAWCNAGCNVWHLQSFITKKK